MTISRVVSFHRERSEVFAFVFLTDLHLLGGYLLHRLGVGRGSVFRHIRTAFQRSHTWFRASCGQIIEQHRDDGETGQRDGWNRSRTPVFRAVALFSARNTRSGRILSNTLFEETASWCKSRRVAREAFRHGVIAWCGSRFPFAVIHRFVGHLGGDDLSDAVENAMAS